MAVDDMAEETPEDEPLAKAMRFVWGEGEFQITPPPSDGDEQPNPPARKPTD